MKVANPVRKVLLAAQDSGVCLVKMVRLVLLVLMALLALLEREVNKDSLVPLASRVCQDLPDLQERVENQVIRVFLEKVVLLV